MDCSLAVQWLCLSDLYLASPFSFTANDQWWAMDLPPTNPAKGTVPHLHPTYGVAQM